MITLWEYATRTYDVELANLPGNLNDMGKDGWELVTVLYIQPRLLRCFFKRMVQI